MRIVAPAGHCEHVLDLLENSPSATNVIYLPGAARKPEGDVILCDVAREDASVLVSDLRELDVDKEGSIAIEHIDSAISAVAAAAEKAAAGPSRRRRRLGGGRGPNLGEHRAQRALPARSWRSPA